MIIYCVSEYDESRKAGWRYYWFSHRADAELKASEINEGLIDDADIQADITRDTIRVSGQGILDWLNSRCQE